MKGRFVIGIILMFNLFITVTDLYSQQIKATSESALHNPKSQITYELPEFIVESTEQSTAGYYIFDLTPYILIIDHFGNPVFYREIPGGSKNFELQPNGAYSYYASSAKGFLVMNTCFQVTDTFFYMNDHLIDFHEFNILENGNYIVLGYDRRVVDMSQYVEGGKPYATVTGMLFQELDPDKNILFEWNSWDHISFLEADTFFVHYKANVLDYMHTNSIVIDYDGHYLMSSRHLSEITKIHRTTGEIIWRMGGSGNEFVFINDTLPFSGQHSALRLKNGNIALLDNGNGRDPQFSRGLEYQVDEIGKSASLVREYRESPDIYSAIMGNVTELHDNHLVVGWGKIDHDVFISEFNEMGEKVTSIYPVPGDNYTSYKVSFLEQFDFFVIPDEDTLDFGIVNVEDSALLSVLLYNAGPDTATLFSFSDESNQFGIIDPLPIRIEGGGSKQINLKFQPLDSGFYHIPFYLNFRLDSTILDDHMAACRLMLEGYCPIPAASREIREKEEVLIFPNPFKDRLTIDHSKDVENMVIWSITGGKVLHIQNYNSSRRILDVSHIPAGIYVVEIIFQDSTREYVKVVKGL